MNNDNAQNQGQSPEQPVQQPGGQASPQANLPPVSFYEPNKGNTSKAAGVKKLLKVLLGLGVIIAFIAIIILIILPILSNSQFGKSKVTLTYWGLWEDSRVMQGVISDFERENKNIKIEYSKQDIKQYRERLLTRVNNGTGPDIFRFHNTWYPMVSGILLPLPKDTISKDEFARTFYPVAQKDLIKNGAIYGIPLEIDTLSLFINNQLYKSAGLTRPVTWNDFINNARAITVKDETGKIITAGAAMGTYDNVTHAPDILSLLFLQNGVDFKNIQGSSDRIEGTLSFYTSFALDENRVWDDTLDPSILAFSKGNLGMFFGYSWNYFDIKEFNPNLDFQVVPVPQLPNQSVNLASYWAEGISAKSKHQKEAFAFLKYLSGKDVVQKLYSEESKVRPFGEPYARIDLAETLKGNASVYTFVYQAPDATSSFFVDSTFDNGLNQQLNTYLGNAVNSTLNYNSPQTAFETFSEGVSQVLQKYGQQ